MIAERAADGRVDHLTWLSPFPEWSATETVRLDAASECSCGLARLAEERVATENAEDENEKKKKEKGVTQKRIETLLPAPRTRHM
jgi:hypothetical protein